MAITSEIIGKLGGGDIETVPVNRLIKKSDDWTALHTITVDKPSLIAVTLTHDNTNSFGATYGGAVIALIGGGNGHYAANYPAASNAGRPLSVAAEISAGTWTIHIICRGGTDMTEYTVQTLTVATVKM